MRWVVGRERSTLPCAGVRPSTRSFAQLTLGICTVKSDATGVSESLFAPEKPQHYNVKVLSSANPSTGLTTYSVQIVREGMTVIFR